jgi:N-acetyl-gamma-glutamyl-phosphate reductase
MIKVGIVGGTGYTGVELLRILAAHPQVKLVEITSRSEIGVSVADLFPNLRGRVELKFTEPDTQRLGACDLVFFATPNGVAMSMAPQLLKAGARIIDLAADFRLQDAAEWERWYQVPHACPDLLNEAVYGLPELNRAKIKSARLIANPGCYPTAVSLGFLPLIERGVVDVSHLIADVKSGVSGAGRKASVAHLYCEVVDSMKAYGVAGHRHLPEIRQTLRQAAGKSVGLTFVPHLTPMIRGIHATLYATSASTAIDLQKLYTERFHNEPFVDVMPAGSHPETRSTRGSNMCRIAIHQPQNAQTIVVLSVIDNLVKGAAGQAVHNMNLMFGYDESLGLEAIPIMP